MSEIEIDGYLGDGTFLDEQGMSQHLCRIGGSDFLFHIFRLDKPNGDVYLKVHLGAEPNEQHGGGGVVEWYVRPEDAHVLADMAHMLHNIAEEYDACYREVCSEPAE